MKNDNTESDISRNIEIKRKRKHLFLIFFSVITAIFFIYSIYYYFLVSRYVSTDNAYVGAEISQVTAQLRATVKEIRVNDADIVKTGDVLVVFDDTDARLALQSANADLSKAYAEAEQAKRHYIRFQALTKSGAVSAEDISKAENEYKSKKALTDAASVAVEQATVNCERTIVTSPVDGVIAKRQIQLGQRVESGTQLMSVVPVANMHVDANFKEVQLRNVKIGQSVELISDFYGSSVVYHGKVVGIAGGTGSSFAMIPAQNATGNWIKVVQRLPVRITIDSEELKKHPLYVGLSMRVDIDISDVKQ